MMKKMTKKHMNIMTFEKKLLFFSLGEKRAKKFGQCPKVYILFFVAVAVTELPRIGKELLGRLKAFVGKIQIGKYLSMFLK